MTIFDSKPQVLQPCEWIKIGLGGFPLFGYDYINSNPQVIQTCKCI